MNQEESVRIFDLVVKGRMLPATMDKLVPLSFIGAAAVKFYQAKVRLMDQLGMSEAQRKATLADGQDAGEMLLNIEARIGELSITAPRTPPRYDVGRGAREAAGPLKAERLGLTPARMKKSEAIHRNPAAVAKIIKQARENEDIPTKTAVLNEIRYEREKKQTALARKEIARLTTGEEQLDIATLGSIYIRIRKLHPFMMMSPRGREECVKMAEKIKQELDTKIETAKAEWEESSG
jgi:hypothetical protein